MDKYPDNLPPYTYPMSWFVRAVVATLIWTFTIQFSIASFPHAFFETLAIRPLSFD